MYICHIAPTAALNSEIIKRERFHMIIASQALKDDTYASFYREAQGIKILDVPTFEERSSESYSLQSLKEVIRKVRPNEVVLPDGWGISVSDNIRMAEDAAYELLSFGLSQSFLGFMVVPHATSLHEYLECAVHMAAIPLVSSIGVAERVEMEFDVRREDVIQALRMVLPRMPLHLLGCLKDLHDIAAPEIRQAVRSM